mgnify:FL=1
MHEYLERKTLVVLNNQVPTRKEHIIHLSIVSPQIFDKTNNWSVQEKVYLNSDHKMISFELVEKEIWKPVQKWDFRKTSWTDYESMCEEEMQKWLDGRNANTTVDDITLLCLK